jgi:tetratricopeptide (TPR) repeat protein
MAVTIALQAGEVERAGVILRTPVSGLGDADRERLASVLDAVEGGDIEKATLLLQAKLDVGERPAQRVAGIEAAIRDGDMKLARRLAKTLRETYPDAALGWYGAGILALAERDRAAAVRAFQRALTVDPMLTAASAYLAQLEVSAGDLEAARRRYTGLVERNPDDRLLRLRLAALEYKAGRADAEARWLAPLVDASYAQPKPYLLLAGYFVTTGRPQRAMDTLSRARKHLGDDPELLRSLLRLQRSLGFWQQALSTATVLVAAQPDDGATRRLLAGTQWQTGQQGEAEDTLEAWLETHPHDYASRVLLAEYAMQQGRLAEAREVYLRVLEDKPNHGAALNNLALLWLKEDPVRANEYARHALRYNPTSAMVHDTLGLGLLAVDDTRAAMEHFAQAVRLQPDNGSYVYHLGRSQILAGRTAEARRTLQSLVARPGDAARLAEVRGLLDSLSGEQ